MSLRKSTIIEKAQKLVLKGKFKQAIKEWQKLAEETPNDGNIYNAIGDLHIKAGEKEEATAAFIQAASSFQEAAFELKCIALYKKALKTSPDRIDIYERLGEVYAERGLIGNAIGDYLKAAKYYVSQGDFPASLVVYRKISDLDPENLNIHLEIAEMCEKQGHKEDAVEEYKKVVGLYDAKESPEQAQEIREKIAVLDPSYATEDVTTEVNPNLSANFDELAESDFEVEDASEEASLDPVSFSADEDLEASFSDAGQSGFLEPEPEPLLSEQTQYSEGDAFSIDNAESPAIPEGEKSISNMLTEADVFMQYGLIEKALKQLELAELCFPQDMSPTIRLKEIYLQQGMTKEAVGVCKKLLAYYRSCGDKKKHNALLDDLKFLQDSLSSSGAEAGAFEEGLSSVDEGLVQSEVPELVFSDSLSALPAESQEGDPFGEVLSEDEQPVLQLEPNTLPEVEIRASVENAFKHVDDGLLFESEANLDDDIEDVLSSLDGGINLVPPKAAAEPDFVDLNDMLSEDLEAPESALEKSIRSFQGEFQDENKTAESETQFDLGVAYKEMGMLAEAMKAFELAAESPNRYEDAMIMVASCYREDGATRDAVNVLCKALEQAPEKADAMVALKYELALLYEKLGDAKASGVFQEIYRVDPLFRDVEKKCGASSASPPPHLRPPACSRDRVSYL